MLSIKLEDIQSSICPDAPATKIKLNIFYRYVVHVHNTVEDIYQKRTGYYRRLKT